MSVVNTQLVVYVASGMPENNTSMAGGVIDNGVRASYDDPSSPNQVVIYSMSGADTSQTFNLTGRTAAGTLVSESMSLNTSALIKGFSFLFNK